jgi:hypothetical protein
MSFINTGYISNLGKKDLENNYNSIHPESNQDGWK